MSIPTRWDLACRREYCEKANHPPTYPPPTQRRIKWSWSCSMRKWWRWGRAESRLHNLRACYSHSCFPSPFTMRKREKGDRAISNPLPLHGSHQPILVTVSCPLSSVYAGLPPIHACSSGAPSSYSPDRQRLTDLPRSPSSTIYQRPY